MGENGSPTSQTRKQGKKVLMDHWRVSTSSGVKGTEEPSKSCSLVVLWNPVSIGQDSRGQGWCHGRGKKTQRC